MSESKSGELVNLTANRYRFFGSEYSSALAPQVISDCLRQGLNPAFAEIFKAHLDDLQLVIRDDLDNSDYSSSELDVLRLPPVQGEEEGPYRRLMIVSRRDLENRMQMLQAALAASPNEIEVNKLRGVALDWCFFDLAFTALNNACFMERTYGCYINDFDGQGKSFLVQYTLSAEYLKQMGDEDASVEEDFKSLQAGFGLMMLPHSILRHKVVKGAKRAEWLTQQLSQLLPDACSTQVLSERLRFIQPDLHAARRIAELALAIFDPELEQQDD